MKIVEGAEWTNSLLDPNTFEWQDLADKVKREVRSEEHTSIRRNSKWPIAVES